MKRTTLTSRLKMGLITGLAAIIGTLNTASAKSPSFYLESAIVSDYVAPHGMFLQGMVNQNLASVDFNNGISGFVWQNYDLGTSSTNEVDFGISYAHKITDNLSASVGAQRFNYFWREFGQFDNVAKAGLNLKTNIIDLKYDMTHMFGHDKTPTGTRHYFRASKTFDLGKLADVNFSLTPYAGTAFSNDYYGCRGYPSQITYGLNLNATKGPWSANFFVNKQDGKVYDDKIWGGASIGYSFGGK